MNRKHLLLPLLASTLLFGLLASSCRATRDASRPHVARAHGPRVEPIDVEHYNLELWLNPDEETLAGRCEILYRVSRAHLEQFTIDFAGLDVSSVEDSDGRELAFEQGAQKLRVHLGKSLDVGDLDGIVVRYSGQPQKGLWYVKDEQQRVVEAWTQGECVDAHWWFPCMDYPADRATSELRVHMPANWVSVAGGERIDVSANPNSRMEHWRMNTPSPPYLMSLCAGEFRVVEEEWDGVPLFYLADAHYGSWMADTFAETAPILAYFSELTGRRYPYPKYSQACVKNFPFGGMENISATTLGESALTDALGQRDGTSHGLVAHEAAHQWFGDLLTCASWSEIWLNEGFATYLTNLYYEHSRGVDEFRVRMRDAQNSYTAADVGKQRRPTVYKIYKAPFDLFFGGQAYAGGAARLHLLRGELGDEAFFAGLRLYVADNAGRSVQTADLRAAMESASEKDLAQFFEQWFHAAGYPELEVKWSWDEALGEVKLRVKQTQSTERNTPAVFHLTVDVELRDGQGRRTSRLTIDERQETFVLPAERRPIWVRFDKHSFLPARVVSIKRGSEWLAIAAEDDDVNGRRDAVDALGQLCASEKVPAARAVLSAAILRRLRDDESKAVRLVAVEAFGRIGGDAARTYLEQAAESDEAAAVRVAALDALRAHGPDKELAAFAAAQFELGYSWQTLVACGRLFAAAAPSEADAWLRERSNSPSPHGVLHAGLLGARLELAQAGLARAGLLEELLELAAREGLASAVRQSAVRGLGLYAGSERSARDLLLSLLETNDYRLRQVLYEALGESRDPLVLRRLRAAHAASLHSRERRTLEAAIAKLSRRVQ